MTKRGINPFALEIFTARKFVPRYRNLIRITGSY